MDRIFGLDKAARVDEGLELLMTVFSSEERAVVESILKDAEIPHLAKARGAGGAVNVITGFNMYGTDIFVPDSKLEEARAIFDPSNIAQELDDSENSENMEAAEENND